MLVDAAARVGTYLRVRRERYGSLYGERPVHRLYQDRTPVDLSADDVESVLHERDALLGALRAVYRERAEFIALLTRTFPSYWVYDGENPGWYIVYVVSPAGQLSWRISPADWELFTHVIPGEDMMWDKHTTKEKYERMRRISWLDHRKMYQS